MTSTTGGAPPATSTTRRYAPSPTGLVGYLHGCLKRRLLYDETTAWGHRYIHEDLAA